MFETARAIVEHVGWPHAILAALVIGGAVLWRRWRKQDCADELKLKRYQKYEAKRAEYIELSKTAVAPELLAAKARELDAMREKGWHELAIAAIVAFAMAATGCQHPDARPVAVMVGTYVAMPRPGEIVPDLPEGESRWWLMSAPTGIRLMMPRDAPVVREGAR